MEEQRVGEGIFEYPDRRVRIRMSSPAVRRLLVVAAVLVFAAGLQLFVLTERTARFFAWTVEPPLTAAFLGAAYWGSVVLEALAARERVWARARIAVPAVFVFTALTLVATLLHLDRFHLDSSSSVTVAATWLWIGIYALVPAWILVAMRAQWRERGTDPRRRRRLPRWVTWLLVMHATILIPSGVALFVAPERFAQMWSWPLTPLTARAIAAWLIGIGVAAAHVVREGDWERARAATYSYVALGVLQLIALARYPDTVSWERPHAWVYVALVVSAIMIGVAGWRAARRPREGSSP